MRKPADIDPVNLTPMIDIVFQMIIFFILTLDLDRFKFNEDLVIPDAPDGEEHKEKDPRTIEVEVAENGDIFISQLKLSEKQLLGILQGSVGRYGQGIPVVFYGSGDATHAKISRVMDICGRAGLSDFRFAAIKEGGKEK